MLNFRKWVLALVFLITFFAATQVYGQATISAPQAREIALAITDGGTVSELNLTSDASGFTYQIVIMSNNVRHEVLVNAQTGAVTGLSTVQAQPAPPVAAIPSAPPPGIGQGVARLDQAAAVALVRAGGGAVRHICLTWERGHAVYHVRVYHNGNRMDYHIDRDTLVVVRERSRWHQNASFSSSSFQRRQMNVTPTLSFNQAAAIALAYKGGGTVREISRSSSRGMPAFDVDIVVNGQRWCFYIDIHTGHIIRYHRD